MSRELYPYIGGGIAPIVAAAARALSEVAEVTVVTSASYQEECARLRSQSDPRTLPDDVDIVFVDEPGEAGFGAFFSYMHAYSARVYDALRQHYGDDGPDIIEFCDYLAEGFVTIQAAHTHAAWLRDTLVCVRLHTTAEICAILDGHIDDEFETASVLEAERYCLRRADRVLWSGGDVLAAYHRVYGRDGLAPGVKIADAFMDENPKSDPGREGGPVAGQPVRLLYLGRFERRKGVHNLLIGLLDSGRSDWHLTLLGGDTDTGPLGTSLRRQLELTAADDPRVTFHDPVPREEVAGIIRAHDLVVVPSLWECWPNVARETLAQNRPLLATAVGGLCELVQKGRSGWLIEGTDAKAIARAVELRLDDPESVTDLIATGGPRQVFEELTDVHAMVDGYQRLASLPRPRAAASVAREPLVSVVVPYFRLDDLLEDTLDSVAAQTYANIETIVVNDGSLRPVDKTVLARVGERQNVTVVTQVNSGLGAARDFGISQARGEYVLPLDADDLIDPTFVERCVEVLEKDRDLAYVGTWVRYMEPDGRPIVDELGGYVPFGNWSTLVRRNNVAGVCTCLIRRAVFDGGFSYSRELTSYEDWLLYQELHDAGWYGAIIPERLFRYRVRVNSMMRQVGSPRLARLLGELRAHSRERDVRWLHGPDRSAQREPAESRPTVAEDKMRRLEQAIEELRSANAALAAAAFASRGAAAVTRLQREEKNAAEATTAGAESEQGHAGRRGLLTGGDRWTSSLSAPTGVQRDAR